MLVRLAGSLLFGLLRVLSCGVRAIIVACTGRSIGVLLGVATVLVIIVCVLVFTLLIKDCVIDCGLLWNF